MKALVAPDSFKECLSAADVAETVGAALREARPDWDVVLCPLADGGEGTVDVVAASPGWEIRRAEVSDPLGRKVSAGYGVKDGTAVIEVASACGMCHISLSERNPLKASSFGVGELLMAARRDGCGRFLVGLGGTATCDGGEGMMRVPGLSSAMAGCRVELLCDVDNPFVGPRGAARVFAPQKGASPEDVEVLERRLNGIAAGILEATGIDVRSMPGAGAAGGLGGAFMAWFGAEAVSGIDRIMDLVGFDDLAAGADFVITGEGRSDIQTLSGKVPAGVLRRVRRLSAASVAECQGFAIGAQALSGVPARSCGKDVRMKISAGEDVPVLLLSGRIEDREALLADGFRAMAEATPRSMPLSEALLPAVARRNLRSALRSLLSDPS
jgi:glycerate 2-kinase